MNLLTVADLHKAIRSNLQNNGGFENEDIFPQEIDLAINTVINKIVDDVWVKVDVVRGKHRVDTGFQENIKALEDVSTLIREAPLVTPLIQTDEYIDFPGDSVTDKRYLIRLFAQPSHKKHTYYQVRLFETEFIGDILENPFTTTQAKSPAGIMFSDSLGKTVYRIFTLKRFILLGVKMSYLKHPAKVELSSPSNPDLPLHMMDQVVDLTVQRLLEQTESRRYQTKLHENINQTQN